MVAIRTVFPIGFSEYNKVCTTSFKPGALRIILKEETNYYICFLSYYALYEEKFPRISIKIYKIYTNVQLILKAKCLNPLNAKDFMVFRLRQF